MKISKIPGLGRFGVFIDDVDLYNISDEEWMEIGKIHLQTLVTIIRTPAIDYRRYGDLINQWGNPRFNLPLNIFRKYGKSAREALFSGELSEEDRLALECARRWPVDRKYEIIRVTPKKDSKGRDLGVFGDGELRWHSNEVGTTSFTPGVSLMGYESMVGSSTGFCTSVDYYESLSESFRSELDEMIVIHDYQEDLEKTISPELIPNQESFYRGNMCPEPKKRVPLIIRSPGGIKGIHYGYNTSYQIEGMSLEQSKNIFDTIMKGMLDEKYIYRHWYQHDGDICLFDNSITLHNRLIKDNGSLPNRVGLRIQYDFDNLTDSVYEPFFQQEFNEDRAKILDLYKQAIELA